MAMAARDIVALIQQAMPKAKVTVLDLSNTNYHYTVTVINPDFASLNKIEQHKAVYKALEGHIGTRLHALSITTGC